MPVSESRDGTSAGGDHDQPYEWDRKPRVTAPFPFTIRQFCFFLILRGRVRDGLIGDDDSSEQEHEHVDS